MAERSISVASSSVVSSQLRSDATPKFAFSNRGSQSHMSMGSSFHVRPDDHIGGSVGETEKSLLNKIQSSR